jgi:uncharacterized membrane protein
MWLNSTRSWTRLILAILFVLVGVHHGLEPSVYLAIMPSYLPWPLELVYLSGLFEVLGGIGLLWKKTRQFAAWGLVVLLIAVYPANIHMLVNDVYLPDMPREKWILWARMPLQFLFGAGVIWAGELWPKSIRAAP